MDICMQAGQSIMLFIRPNVFFLKTQHFVLRTLFSANQTQLFRFGIGQTPVWCCVNPAVRCGRGKAGQSFCRPFSLGMVGPLPPYFKEQSTLLPPGHPVRSLQLRRHTSSCQGFRGQDTLITPPFLRLSHHGTGGGVGTQESWDLQIPYQVLLNNIINDIVLPLDV